MAWEPGRAVSWAEASGTGGPSTSHQPAGEHCLTHCPCGFFQSCTVHCPPRGNVLHEQVWTAFLLPLPRSLSGPPRANTSGRSSRGRLHRPAVNLLHPSIRKSLGPPTDAETEALGQDLAVGTPNRLPHRRGWHISCMYSATCTKQQELAGGQGSAQAAAKATGDHYPLHPYDPCYH